MNEECTAIVESWAHLHDVPIRLSVELGRAKLTFGEVVDLKRDTIIRLPRSTGEGIDIRSGAEVLFRGEIIVIDDRAGVRVNEIVSENRK